VVVVVSLADVSDARSSSLECPQVVHGACCTLVSVAVMLCMHSCCLGQYSKLLLDRLWYPRVGSDPDHVHIVMLECVIVR
jgi:hypothetical protein